MRRTAALLALSLLAASPTPSRAQDGGRQALYTSFAAWMSDITGNRMSARDLALNTELHPRGDGFALYVPLGPRKGGPELSATIRQVVGRWVVSGIGIPNFSEFPLDSQGGVLQITTGGQDGQLRIDPSATSASTGDLSLEALGVRIKDGGGEMLTQAAKVLLTTLVRPALDDHADLLTDFAVERASSSLQARGIPPFRGQLDAARLTLSIEGMSRLGTREFVQSLSPHKQEGAENWVQPTLAGVVDSGLRATDTVTVAAMLNGLDASSGRMRVTLGASSIGAKATEHIDRVGLELEIFAGQIGVENTPPLPFAALIPSRVVASPSVTGIMVPGLLALAQAADQGREPTPAEIQALFPSDGIHVKLDTLQLTMAGAEFIGSGELTATGPAAIAGVGRISVDKLDSLQQALASNPATAQALPALILLKGIGRSSGSATVWDISFRDKKLIVNGQDVIAMVQAARRGGNPFAPGR